MWLRCCKDKYKNSIITYLVVNLIISKIKKNVTVDTKIVTEKQNIDINYKVIYRMSWRPANLIEIAFQETSNTASPFQCMYTASDGRRFIVNSIDFTSKQKAHFLRLILPKIQNCN
jgi:hypothetical protein